MNLNIFLKIIEVLIMVFTHQKQYLTNDKFLQHMYNHINFQLCYTKNFIVYLNEFLGGVTFHETLKKLVQW